MATSKHKRKRYVFLGLALLVGLWLLGDFVYSRVIDANVSRFEASIERDANGVQEGCHAYTIGNGRTALLLVHGYLDTPRTFRKMATALSERNFTVRVMRLPGFGVPVQQMNECTWRDWVNEVEREIRALSAKHDRVIVVAHSLGAASTLRLLADDDKEIKERVEGVVLLAPAIKIGSRRSPILSARQWHRIGRSVLVFTNVLQSPFGNDAQDPAEQHPPDKSTFSTGHIIGQIFELLDENRGAAGKIDIPVLMFLTRNDNVIDWVAAESFFELLATRDKQLKFYDTSGHAMTVDYDWQKITDDIDAFANGDQRQ